MSFTPWFIDSFEHGRIAAAGALGVWDQIAGAPAIVTGQKRTGTRGLEITAAGAAERATYLPAASTRYIVNSVYILFTSAFPGATVQVVNFANANGPGRVRYNSATQKFQVNINNIDSHDVGPTLALDTWYLVESIFDCRTGTAVHTCRIDEGAAVQSSNAQTAADITTISLGTASAETVTAYYDDWAMSVTADDTMLGHHQVENLIPTSDGTHNITTSGDFDSFTTTQFSNATTTGSGFLGHRPLQAANTAENVIRQELGTTANYMEFLLGNMSADVNAPIAAVRTYGVYVESATSGASLAEARLCLSDGTEVLTTGSLSMINTTEDPGTTVTLKKRMAIDPSGGWTGTKVNGLLARVGFGDNSPDVNFIDFMVDVLVQSSVSPAPSAIAGVTALTAPVTVADATAGPSAIAGVSVLTQPTVVTATSATALPSAIAGVTVVSTPTVVAHGVALPGVIVGVTAVSTPSVVIVMPDATALPSAIACLTSVPTPTAKADGTALPSVIVCVASVPTPVVVALAAAVPAVVAAVAAIPAPTTIALARAPPAVVAAVAAVPTPTTLARANAIPGVIAAIAAVPTPVALVAGNAIAVPSAIPGATSVPAVTVTALAVAIPSVVAGVASIPAPATHADANTGAVPAIAAMTAVPTAPVILDTSATVEPAVIAATTEVPAVVVIADALAEPEVIAAFAVIGARAMVDNSWIVTPGDEWPVDEDVEWPVSAGSEWPQTG